MPEFEIICLANSKKLSGRCIAGLRTDGKGWLRPVSESDDGTLFHNHYLMAGNREPRPLDIVTVPLVKARPEPHQPENWTCANRPWRFNKRMSPKDFKSFAKDYIISDGVIFGCTNRCVAFEKLVSTPISKSLMLIKPSDLKWRVTIYRENKKPRACFNFGNQSYDLPVTDPVWRSQISNLGLGDHNVEETGISGESEVLLTLSLGEPFDDGCCYKLVSAIIIL